MPKFSYSLSFNFNPVALIISSFCPFMKSISASFFFSS
jgi:hypothetical protein